MLSRSPKDVTIMQRRLIRAGFRGPNALKILYGAKVALAARSAAADDGVDVELGHAIRRTRSWPCLLRPPSGSSVRTST